MEENENELAKSPEEALTQSVSDAYQKAKNLVESARQGIEDAIDAIVECGMLLESAKATMGSRYHEWLTNQAKVHPEEAKKILSVYHDRERATTKRMLHNAGILELSNDAPEQHQRTPDPFAWCRWVPKIREQLDAEHLSAMSPDQLEVALVTLKPVMELAQEIERRLA